MHKNGRRSQCSFSYSQAGSFVNIADRVVMRAAAVVVIAAGSSLERAASPCKAILSIIKDAATSAAIRAGKVIITHRWRFHWRWRRWTGIGGVLAFLDRVRGFDCNSTFSSWAGNVSLHSDIAALPPALAPRVPHNPVVFTLFSSVTHSGNTMVQIYPTFSSKYALEGKGRK